MGSSLTEVEKQRRGAEETSLFIHEKIGTCVSGEVVTLSILTQKMIIISKTVKQNYWQQKLRELHQSLCMLENLAEIYPVSHLY